MNDLTTKLAEALRQTASAHELGVFMSGSGLTNAREALRLYEQATAQPVQDLPPLPALCEQVCAAIKAADDKSVEEAGYMLDSIDCIAIVRKEFARAAMAATPAPAPHPDTERLDYLQKSGSTVSLTPDPVDPGNAMAFKFCVGGLWRATSRSVRDAIDAARAGQGKEASNG